MHLIPVLSSYLLFNQVPVSLPQLLQYKSLAHTNDFFIAVADSFKGFNLIFVYKGDGATKNLLLSYERPRHFLVPRLYAAKVSN